MIKTRRISESNSQARRAADIAGLIFFFTGAACLLWLTFNQSAPVPDLMVRCLRILAGSGAFAIPVILMFVGTMFLVGYDRLAFNHSTAGSRTGRSTQRALPPGLDDEEEPAPKKRALFSFLGRSQETTDDGPPTADGEKGRREEGETTHHSPLTIHSDFPTPNAQRPAPK